MNAILFVALALAPGQPPDQAAGSPDPPVGFLTGLPRQPHPGFGAPPEPIRIVVPDAPPSPVVGDRASDFYMTALLFVLLWAGFSKWRRRSGF